MTHPSIERRKRQRERIDVDLTARCIDEGRGEKRLTGAGVTQTVGGLRLINGNRIALNYGIKNPVAGADAGLAWAAEDFAKQSIRLPRRVRQAQPRSKLVFLRHQRIGNSRVSWIHEAGGSRRGSL